MVMVLKVLKVSLVYKVTKVAQELGSQVFKVTWVSKDLQVAQVVQDHRVLLVTKALKVLEVSKDLLGRQVLMV